MLNALAGAAAGFMALFGGASTTIGHPPVNIAGFFRGHASSTISGSANISCVAAAVAAREQSLDTGVTTLTGSLNDAYSARATALASAYADSGTSTIRAAVKSAWTTFSASVKLARKTWTTAQRGAWSQFATSLKACGAGASTVSDSGDESLDAALGQ